MTDILGEGAVVMVLEIAYDPKEHAKIPEHGISPVVGQNQPGVVPDFARHTAFFFPPYARIGFAAGGFPGRKELAEAVRCDGMLKIGSSQSGVLPGQGKHFSAQGFTRLQVNFTAVPGAGQ